jgi:6-phosphogluconolactonase (cycloisomerase 2 family)
LLLGHDEAVTRLAAGEAMDRRMFNLMLASSVAASRSAWASAATARFAFYASVGPAMTLYDVDVDSATLTRRSSVQLPANVQYAWPHPSRQYLYVVSSNGEPGGGDAPKGDLHTASAFRIGTDGALTPHGAPARLPSRPIHTSVDGTGRFLLIAYNDPSNVTVSPLNADGTIGEFVMQRAKPDAGIYAHQIRTTPNNRTAVLVTRGNNPTRTHGEDPGALKVFAFNDGQLTKMQSLAPNNGYGFGPRHLDFHPSLPFVYVSLERQNRLYTYRLNDDGRLSDTPIFMKNSLADPEHVHPGQGAGTVHVHPNGRFVYQANRNANVVDFRGQKIFGGGENNMAVWAIDPASGEPTLIQTIDGRGIQLRTFGIDPSGRLLIAASIQPLLIRDGNSVMNLSAGLTVYRIASDGKLTFARKYDVDTTNGTQFWSGVVPLA